MRHSAGKGTLAIWALLLTICAAWALTGAVRAGEALSPEQLRTAQRQLAAWGYYQGEEDGINGGKTRAAVRAFQKRNGLRETGEIEGRTAELLGLSPEGGRASGMDASVYLLARLVQAEVGGQPYEVQAGVAAMALNRVADPAFPNSIAAVVYQKGAFAGVENGHIDMPPEAQALRAARDAMNGWDLTGESTFYSRENVTLEGRTVMTILGEYKFYR